MSTLGMASNQAREQHHYLRLKMGTQRLLISLNQIQMVLPILELQIVPNDEPALAGILNYHGKPIPVYHLAELIHTSKPDYDINALIIMSPLSSNVVAFLVSEEVDLVVLSEDEIQPTPIHNNKFYIEGLIEKEEWSAWILDLDKLVQSHLLKKTHV